MLVYLTRNIDNVDQTILLIKDKDFYKKTNQDASSTNTDTNNKEITNTDNLASNDDEDDDTEDDLSWADEIDDED